MKVDFNSGYYLLIEKFKQYAVRKIKIIGLVLFIDCCLVVVSAFSNGIEFYERYAVEEKGTLDYVTGPNELPPSNRILLSCRDRSDLNAPCISKAIQTLKSEHEKEKSSNLKAWKLFLLGNIHFEANHLQEASEFFKEGAQTAIDHKLKATLLHRLLITHIILRDMNGTLQVLDTLLSNFPNYNHYDKIFFTFPVWFPDPIHEIAKKREVFIRTRETQRELAQVSKSQETQDEYVRLSIRLGQLYDQACPLKTTHEVVCQDALEIYHAIYREFPKLQGADYAFLEIQNDTLSYEVLGLAEVHSMNVVELYGSFLKQYPGSPLAKDVQQEYQKAIWTLKALKVKTYGGIEILSKEDAIQGFQMNLFMWNSIASAATSDAEVRLETQKEPDQDAHALTYHHPFPADSYTRLLPIYSNYEEKPVALTLSIIYSAKSPFFIVCHNEIMAEALKNKAEKEMNPEFSVTTTITHTNDECTINFYIMESAELSNKSSTK